MPLIVNSLSIISLFILHGILILSPIFALLFLSSSNANLEIITSFALVG